MERCFLTRLKTRQGFPTSFNHTMRRPLDPQQAHPTLETSAKMDTSITMGLTATCSTVLFVVDN